MVARLFSNLGYLLVIGSLVLSAAADRSSRCSKPKVRKEWRQLSDSERSDWIGAVNCLGALPHDPKLRPSLPLNVTQIPPISNASSFYDDIVYVHMDLNFNIHYTAYFLPFHRQYVQFFENSLVEKCGYTGAQPYWDWRIDSHDVEHSAIWDSSPSGLGGWGDPKNDFQIYSGGFKDQIRLYPSPHHIRRNFSLYPFTNPFFQSLPAGSLLVPTDFMPNTTMTKENVAFMVDGFDGDFIGFQAYFEGGPGPHGGAHLIMAADMGGLCPHNGLPPDCTPGAKWTPNDPVFFLHHAMVDKLWWEWQNRLPMNKLAYGGGATAVFGTPEYEEFPTGSPPFLNFSSTIPGDGFWEDVTIWDMMDTQKGGLCYVYT